MYGSAVAYRKDDRFRSDAGLRESTLGLYTQVCTVYTVDVPG